MNCLTKLIIGFGIFLGLSVSPSFAEEEEQPVTEPAKLTVCSACHGADGNKSMTPDTPKLGGQAADYIAQALKQYQNGMRNHPIMGAMAAGLTEQDIDELSNYFSNQDSQLHTKY